MPFAPEYSISIKLAPRLMVYVLFTDAEKIASKQKMDLTANITVTLQLYDAQGASADAIPAERTQLLDSLSLRSAVEGINTGSV